MTKYTFPQVKNDKYNVIIKAENEEVAKHRYEVLYGIEPDV